MPVIYAFQYAHLIVFTCAGLSFHLLFKRWCIGLILFKVVYMPFDVGIICGEQYVYMPFDVEMLVVIDDQLSSCYLMMPNKAPCISILIEPKAFDTHYAS